MSREPGVCLGLYETHALGDAAFIGKLKLGEDVLRVQRLLNGNMLIAPHRLAATELSAVRSARRLLDGLREREFPAHAGWHVKRVAAGGAQVAGRLLYERARRRSDPAIVQTERWTGADARSFRLNYQAEQVPDRANRVTLSTRVDALGYRVPRLEWRWSPEDLGSIIRTRQIVADELAAAGVGQMVKPEPNELPVGELGGRPRSAHHHLGTTRMSRFPEHGVVDRNCRVHGAPVVFVCGGSVFTTGGHANPTLTLVALALRVADEILRDRNGRTAPVV